MITHTVPYQASRLSSFISIIISNIVGNSGEYPSISKVRNADIRESKANKRSREDQDTFALLAQRRGCHQGARRNISATKFHGSGGLIYTFPALCRSRPHTAGRPRIQLRRRAGCFRHGLQPQLAINNSKNFEWDSTLRRHGYSFFGPVQNLCPRSAPVLILPGA